MDAGGISRRMLAFAGPLGLAYGSAALAAQRAVASPAFELAVRPTRVFKVADRSHEDTETWIVSVVVQTGVFAQLKPASMQIVLLKAGQPLRTIVYSTAGFTPLTYQTAAPRLLADGAAPASPIFWPFLIRLRFTEPRALGVEAMRLTVETTDAAGRRQRQSLTVPIETYVQKTSLVFPFRGKGIVLQAGAANGGHRNRSGMFALDACGLDEAWSVVAAGDGKKNTDYPGWGRQIIAPADGVVVRARADRPDQPVADASDPRYYAPEYPQGGDPGNHLTIDHGRGEFSMIAHFQAGSLQVKIGDSVRQGQPLGKLGHSGDTNAPHVHYQLQAGPDWEYADALPARFSNVNEEFLDRGTYFETA